MFLDPQFENSHTYTVLRRKCRVEVSNNNKSRFLLTFESKNAGGNRANYMELESSNQNISHGESIGEYVCYTLSIEASNKTINNNTMYGFLIGEINQWHRLMMTGLIM